MIVDLLWALGMGLTGAVVFGAIGLVSGTDETATLGPLTLIVVLAGVPPVGVFTFFIAAAVSKHMTHAIPTTLLGIPGDTMAVPLMEDADGMRRLGAPHIALRKALAGALLSAVIAVPVAVGIATALAPLSEAVEAVAPWLFAVAAIFVGYFSPGRWASIVGIVPFTLAIAALHGFTERHLGDSLSISFFLGIAIGPLLADLVRSTSRQGRMGMERSGTREFRLAPDLSDGRGFFPNPLRVLTRQQIGYTAGSAVVSSSTFMFSPVATTVIVGEAVGSRLKHPYQRLSSLMAVKNGTTESTYLAETIIPLVAFGLPLSPVAAGPAAALFNAPPVYSVESGQNLHSMLSSWQFLLCGLLGVLVAAVVVYPVAMKYARVASAWVITRISHEALIAAFAGLIVVVSWYEGGLLGLFTSLTVGLLGGLCTRAFGMNAGVQFMCYYTATMFVPLLLAS
ncbi:tripartite tricarboxylate transporter permease [Prauserella rugosa]|uniref:Tripartite tricarboxylate transporter TctA family protein n=1 Tax=Prauserella rugosa TaxID=43354 RepID=A0A660CE36_9PSEU|nr:tripartite tricarboxylate transporter permease [Prauserella rugosa]KMS72015.1 membrane protein [Streptomyces regensis]TWH21810.1 tripartite tricarboxylate transporter TctA family protein [Prauserella rugosa]